jgi:predicted dehydrogenase
MRMQSLVRAGVAELCAIADPSADALAAASRIAPSAARLRGLDDLLSCELDGIVISTPSALHAAQARVALQGGLAVFCQKPVGRNAAETRDVVDSAQAANRLLATDFGYRYTSAMRQIKQLADTGDLGQLYFADLSFHNSYGPDKHWYYDPSLSGGGCLIDLGIHLIDLVLWIFDSLSVGQISSCRFAKGVPLQPGCITRVEDHAAASLVLNCGATARITCSWGRPTGGDAHIQALFYGTGGTAEFHNINGSFYDFRADHYVAGGRHVLSLPPDDWSGRAIIKWAARLNEDRSFDPAAEQMIAVAEILDRIYGRDCAN